MKDKTEAARLLLEAGWTFEEAQRVLGGEPPRYEYDPNGVMPVSETYPMDATPNYWPWWVKEICTAGPPYGGTRI